jgi:flagellar hook-length control protein FliK
MRDEVISSTFGAAASAADQPLRGGAAESMPAVEPASDIKASGLAAMFAAPVGVPGAGLSASHAVQAAVATTPRSAIAIDPAAESDLPRQIVQAMRLQWKDGIGDARIRLLPDYLGEVNVAIRVEHGTVMAVLEASTPAVRQWVESHEPMLRQSLAEQGLHLDRLIVSAEPQQTALNHERRREKREETQQEQQPQPRRRQPADDTTFEVVV